MLQIDTGEPVRLPAFLHLGFRPFFTGAMLFAVASVLLWFFIYVRGWTPAITYPGAVTWHAHEMIFGYAMAVVSGFLLTAIRNWTNRQTLFGWPLLGLALLWLAGRVLPFVPGAGLWPAAAMELLFLAGLTAAAGWPVFRARQWHNMGIIAKLVLMVVASALFHAGVAGMLAEGVRWGLYGGLYLVLGLIFMMGRRVIPFFIERGVDGGPVSVRNWRWLDISSLVLFVLFALADLAWPNGRLAGGLAAVLFGLHGLRLVGWHVPGIWRKPLLWILYVAYAWLVIGFALKALSAWTAVSPNLGLHAFAYGGIGMMTAGMMARVALGHTGRNVHEAPPGLVWVFLLLGAGVLVRVIVPLIDSGHYVTWIAASQVLWVAAFALLAVIYVPMLARRLGEAPRAQLVFCHRTHGP